MNWFALIVVAFQAVSAAVLLSRPARRYHVETVDSLAASRQTHVQVAGTVTLVRKEEDGDWHIRIEDAHGHFVVAEIIPTLQATPPLTVPRVGQAIVAYGIRRQDGIHAWPEIHPLEQWIEAVK